VRLSSSGTANQPPTAVITTPATDVTIYGGEAVAFVGTGTDDGTITGYSWSFPGGSPASSSSQSPQVTYSTPGGHVASLAVTDNGGLTSTPATRTITVADFALSAAPSSQSVVPGGSASYTITVNPGTGFSGNVSFGVSGLPTGATATFNPAAVNTSGSTVLTVTTAVGTPAGSSQLVITGNTGAFRRTVNLTLVVSGTFSLSASPASATIKRGGGTNYTITITGASSPVALSVSGLPKFASSRFSPSSVAGSGTATLTIGTNNNVAIGTSTLTITGTMGSTTRSGNVSLVITQ
jgi:PKD repeat protein